MPASWPLYIVEFKAGCTDLFYLTDLTLDVRVGDLVIVEVDQGKDLGMVVNDMIMLKELEVFKCEQREHVAYGDGGPLSPGGQQGEWPKKEINLKMIYGEAQDTQCIFDLVLGRYYGFSFAQIDTRLSESRLETDSIFLRSIGFECGLLGYMAGSHYYACTYVCRPA